MEKNIIENVGINGMLDVDVNNKKVYSKFNITLSKRFGRKMVSKKLKNYKIECDSFSSGVAIDPHYSSDSYIKSLLDDGWCVTYCMPVYQ